MVSNLIIWLTLGVAFIFMILYCVWLNRPDIILKKEYPDVVSLPDGSLLNIINYPKMTAINDLPEKGIYQDDLIICDPETYPKIHVHDVVIYKNDYLYSVDTCHKDGTYTLKRTGEKLERQNRNDISFVARYSIKYPYDGIVDVVL